MVNGDNDNYGAYLQAFALKNAIEKFTPHRAEVLPIERDLKSRKMNGGVGFVNFFSSLNKKRKLLIGGLKKITRLRKFRSWLKAFATNGESFFRPAAIEDKLRKFDVLVVGSDSVWFLREDEINQPPERLSELRQIFFGWLPPRRQDLRRITYAASQGLGVPDVASQLMRDSLGNFNAISVREKESVDYLRKIAPEVNVMQVCDPTCLLEREDLAKVESQKLETNLKEGYIAVYVLPSKTVDDIRRYVLRLQKETGFGIKIVNLRSQFFIPGADMLGEYIGPGEFLTVLKNSSYCVTNSFHGMVFSILYHRPFTAFQRKPGGRDFRQANLVTMLGLEERLVAHMPEGEDLFNCPIDWTRVEEKRKSRIKSSICYLQSNL